MGRRLPILRQNDKCKTIFVVIVINTVFCHKRARCFFYVINRGVHCASQEDVPIERDQAAILPENQGESAAGEGKAERACG